MGNQVITVNGYTLPTPSKFAIERYNLTKSGRVISGNMTMELIAKKRKFVFEYKAISGVDMQAILDVLDTNDMFMSMTYKDANGVAKSATVYVGALPSTQFRTDGTWTWTDFNFSLIEQ